MASGVWFLRVYSGVRHSFPSRKLEWLMSVAVVAWGDSFVSSPQVPSPDSAWRGLTFWAPSWLWGWAMIIIGVMRLTALTINGTFHDTVYSQYSPLVRGATGGLCSILWLAVALSSLSAGTQSAVAYLLIFFVEAFVSYPVAGEAGDNLKAHRDGHDRRSN